MEENLCCIKAPSKLASLQGVTSLPGYRFFVGQPQCARPHNSAPSCAPCEYCCPMHSGQADFLVGLEISAVRVTDSTLQQLTGNVHEEAQAQGGCTRMQDLAAFPREVKSRAHFSLALLTT